MKKIIALFSLVCATGLVAAQELPKLSQPSKSEHVVGVTKISLQYSRPSVRGRVIFGDVVPYDEVWRLGANEPTKLTSTHDLNIAGQVLPAGSYAVFALPAANGNWKIVFNSDFEQWGAGNYDKAKDVVTAEVRVGEGPFTETLLIDINKVTTNGASLVIGWEKVWIEVPFTVETDKYAQANIDAAIAEGKDLDKVYMAASNYYFTSKEDLDKAISYIDQSIAVKKTFSNLFVKARILHKKGDTKGAIKLAEEAKALAEAEKNDRWVGYIQENLDEWNKK